MSGFQRVGRWPPHLRGRGRQLGLQRREPFVVDDQRLDLRFCQRRVTFGNLGIEGLLRILDLERQLADVTVERDKALAELAEARNRAKELR